MTTEKQNITLYFIWDMKGLLWLLTITMNRIVSSVTFVGFSNRL